MSERFGIHRLAEANMVGYARLKKTLPLLFWDFELLEVSAAELQGKRFQIVV